MTSMIRTVGRAANAAGQVAREQYLDRVPEPTVFDVQCPYCAAPVGRQCRRFVASDGEHPARVDWATRAGRRRRADAYAADDAAYLVATARANGSGVGHIIAALEQHHATAYLVAKGWTWLSGLGDLRAWCPPDPADRSKCGINRALRTVLSEEGATW